jgi:hypothetical protein
MTSPNAELKASGHTNEGFQVDAHERPGDNAGLGEEIENARPQDLGRELVRVPKSDLRITAKRAKPFEMRVMGSFLVNSRRPH